MSAHYTTEPNPTASATLNTTFGPLHISLFATQTPLTCRNFLQHCQDGYYTDTIFHRVVPGFIIQGGDPTGTGSGGTSIYEDPEFEYDPEARDPDEKVVLRDELHSRLRYNRRGLVGMAKSEDGSYGSQFFITLGNTERELNGQCTLFGRIEGDSIYNMVKIAEAERVEGTEQPVYPVKITSCEIGELGPLAGKIKKRQITATRTARTEDKPAPKKKKKNKGGKTLLSFGDDGDGDEDMPIRPAKPKFNSSLNRNQQRRPRSPSPEPKHRPKTPEPETQLPLPKPESPDRSPEPAAPKQSFLSRTNAEIENLKASMRRTAHTGAADTGPKKSALEAMIPETAIRGRRRPPPGTSASTNGSNGITGFSSSADNDTLKLFNAFKAKLENADSPDDEEAQLCDLHFIANCQSCQSWDDDQTAEGGKAGAAAEDEEGWLTHELRFGKDTLGKDLKWKREHPDDADSLMVIDPREKEKEYVGGKRRGLERDRERDRKRERVGNLEWDKARRGK
ncbi:putative peptidyl-prolyl cis-trans isomerase [Aspergillus bombycis]|uniref:Peptidyl-prolyl isomerase CWC27 n=1 Tax=Aspergillus bombycis TaxID=109264 RepID=A0A1F8A406_9EURO|nr:putative peptidyl-prolyl cis-trans isomerase [Aspergillus bombycis]OGM46470.1 putative peptidyl-prolyl cis-trans isomerase [Aspergillus bombycis]